MSSLKKNLAFNITYQILILFLPLVTSSYLARVIGAEGIGRYSYAYSIALYFTYFTLLGLNKYGNRKIASVKSNRAILSRAFSEIYLMQIICFAICFIIYLFCSLFIFQDREISLILGMFVLSSLFDINWFFFGMEMFDKTVIRNAIIKILTTILIFVLVKDRNDVDKYAMIMSAGYLISQLALWPYLRRCIDKVHIHVADIRQHLMPNILMFMPVIAVSVYRILDKIMLGMFSTHEDLGYFENAEKIINVPTVIVAALGTVMLPRVTTLISEKKDSEVIRYRDISVMIVTIFSVGALFGFLGVSEPLTVWMYGESFRMSGVIMQYLAFTLVFLGIGDVIRSQYLIPYKYDRIYIVSAFLGAFVNIVLNLVLIPRYHAIGASIGTIGAEITVCMYQVLMIKKYLPLLKYLKNIVLCSIGGILMLMIISNVNHDSYIIELINRIVLGMFIYIAFCALLYAKVLKQFILKNGIRFIKK